MVNLLDWSSVLAGPECACASLRDSWGAGGICEPRRPAHGVGHRDEPSVFATRPIDFVDTCTMADGCAWMHVEPCVRFAPTGDPARRVAPSMKTRSRLDVAKRYGIQWRHQGRSVDESRSGSTLVPWIDHASTTVDSTRGRSPRRTTVLRHFPPSLPVSRAR